MITSEAYLLVRFLEGFCKPVSAEPGQDAPQPLSTRLNLITWKLHDLCYLALFTENLQGMSWRSLEQDHRFLAWMDRLSWDLDEIRRLIRLTK